MAVSSLFIVTGPSGVGKTYLAQHLVRHFPDTFKEVRVFTTRAPRNQENSSSDRIFISKSEFKQRQIAGDFLVSGIFHNNWYGWLASDINESPRPLILNTWPALVPQFASLDQSIVVALTTNQQGRSLLKDRMLQRGDSPETVDERMKLVDIDIANIQKYSDIIQSKGRIFTISDNSSISSEIAPWLLNRL